MSVTQAKRLLAMCLCLACSVSAAAAPATAAPEDPEAGLDLTDLVESGAEPAEAEGPRRLGIGEIKAPAESDARGAVLEALSARSEVEVVGYEDVKMAGKNLGVDPATPRGRKRISDDLGVFAWVEGQVSARHEATLRLVDGNGRTLATMRVSADDGPALDTAIRGQLWNALGRFVSDAAAREHALHQQQKRATKKHQARLDELERQKEVALERETRRTKQLNDQRGLARNKQEARFEELQRQVEIVLARRDEEARQLQLAADQAAREERERVAAQQRQLEAQQRQEAEAARLAEAQRRQEEARLAALARQQQMQQAQASNWQPAPQASWQPAQAQPAQSWNTQPARPAAGYQPSGRFPRYQGTGQAPSRFAAPPSYVESQSDYGAPVSPETQRWLEARNAAR